MRSIKIRLRGTFKENYDDRVKKGTKVFIDRIKGFAGCKSYLHMRVANIWKKPRWFDSGWFRINLE